MNDDGEEVKVDPKTDLQVQQQISRENECDPIQSSVLEINVDMNVDNPAVIASIAELQGEA